MSLVIRVLAGGGGSPGVRQMLRRVPKLLITIARFPREALDDRDRRRRILELSEPSRRLRQELEALNELPTIEPRR